MALGPLAIAEPQGSGLAYLLGESGLSVDSMVGVFGLTAYYPLLFEDLMSKLMGLLIVALSLRHSKLWEACWRYVMQYIATVKEQGTAQLDDADITTVQKHGAALPPDSGTLKDQGIAPSTSSTSSRDEDTAQHRDAVPSPLLLAGSTALHGEPATPDSQSAAPPRRISRHLRPELADQMVQLYRSGHTAADIASMFGFHRQTVARHLKRAGLSMRTNTSDPVFRLRVQQTYQTIGTIKGTARQLRVSPGAVRVVVQGG